MIRKFYEYFFQKIDIEEMEKILEILSEDEKEFFISE